MFVHLKRGLGEWKGQSWQSLSGPARSLCQFGNSKSHGCRFRCEWGHLGSGWQWVGWPPIFVCMSLY